MNGINDLLNVDYHQKPEGMDMIDSRPSLGFRPFDLFKGTSENNSTKGLTNSSSFLFITSSRSYKDEFATNTPCKSTHPLVY